MKKIQKKGKPKGKLLQIRLSHKEYEKVKAFMKKFDATHRDYILATVNELSEKTVLRDGYFWLSDQEFAYLNRERWEVKLDAKSQCELCGAGRTDYVGSIVRHHHYGYEGDNAFKVQVVCNKCHGRLSGKKWRGKPWEYVKENWVKPN